MGSINNNETVKKQYANADNLSARISIHDKYSTNKMGFGNWILSNYNIEKGMKVLELRSWVSISLMWICWSIRIPWK